MLLIRRLPTGPSAATVLPRQQQQLRPYSSNSNNGSSSNKSATVKGRLGGGGGGGSDAIASAVREGLRAAAAVSAEGAAAFFKPQASSPLSHLRPPLPPSAADAKPFFGQLNRSHRRAGYVNANAATAPRAALEEGGEGGGAATTTTTTANPTVAPKTMHLDKLVRNNRGSSGASPSPSTPSPLSPTSTGGGSPQVSQGEEKGGAAASPSSSGATDTVKRAQAAIAAAAAAAAPSSPSSSSSHNDNNNNSSSSSSAKEHSTSAALSSSAAAAAAAGGDGRHRQVYREHCTIGWSPEELYSVVADVGSYPAFLPWCTDATVHTVRPVTVPAGDVEAKSPHFYKSKIEPLLLIQQQQQQQQTTTTANNNNHNTSGGGGGGSAAAALSREALAALPVDAEEMTATLAVGFSFFKEQYTSRVTLLPGAHITAVLADEDPSAADGSGGDGDDGLLASLFRRAAESTGVSAVKKSVLTSLQCDWDFIPVPGRPNEVEVVFSVSFEFKNPMHARLIMTNIVALMTRSFERQCERLYGPPSATKQVLPLHTI